MSKREIDEYLAGLGESQRDALAGLRTAILRVIPDAEQCLSYGVPGFRVDGEVVAGFAAAKNHLSYFPHSGSVLSELEEELAGYDTSRGTLRFAVDAPLPDDLVEKLIAIRLRRRRVKGEGA